MDVLVGLVALFVVVLACLGYLVWPVVIVSAIVMFCQKKGWAEAGHVYAACIGSFVGAVGWFIVWAEMVGSLEGPPAAVALLFVNPLTAGATLGTIAGIAVWEAGVRIANWRERRIGEHPQ